MTRTFCDNCDKQIDNNKPLRITFTINGANDYRLRDGEYEGTHVFCSLDCASRMMLNGFKPSPAPKAT